MLTNYDSISDISSGDDGKYYKMYSRYRSVYNQIDNKQPLFDNDFIKRTSQNVFFEKNNLEEINRSLFGETESKSSISDRTLWRSVYDCHDLCLNVSFYLSDEKRTDYMSFSLQHT